MGIVTSIYKYFFGGGSCEDDFVVDPATGLTRRQKNLIVDSWCLLGCKKDQKRYGVNFFIYLFREYPYQKDIFPLFRDKTLSELEVSPIMRAHATTVMYQIGSFVDNLDDIECLVGLIQKVAKNHVARSVELKQFEELRTMFGPFLREYLGPTLANPEVVKAWDTLLATMNSIIEAEIKADSGAQTKT